MLDLDWTSSDCTSVLCPARLPSHRSAITTALFPGAGGPLPVYSILSLLESSLCILLHYTTLHSTTAVPAYCSLILPSFITVRPRPASTPHYSSSSLPIFLHTWIWNPLATLHSDMPALPLV
jgi:hypothetical protein